MIFESFTLLLMDIIIFKIKNYSVLVKLCSRCIWAQTSLYLNYFHGMVCILFEDIKFLILFSYIPKGML